MKKEYLPKQLLSLWIVILVSCLNTTTTLSSTFKETAIGVNFKKLTCPESPSISTRTLEICSGGGIVINGDFEVLGTSTGAIEVSVNPSLGGDLEDDFVLTADMDYEQSIVLPSNTSCEPIVYRFSGVATCSDGSVIPPDEEEALSFTVTVYPEYNENLIAIQKGNCDRAGKAVPICDNYEVERLGSPTTPNQGESGFDQWQVTYVGGTANGPMCILPTIIDVPYACGNACPQDPSITIELASNSDYFGNQLDVCGGESVIFKASFGIEGDINDGTIFISSRDIIVGEIPIGKAFELPINNGCDPVSYVFLGDAICDNGTVILGRAERMLATVTVYPNAFSLDFITLTDGTCDEAGIATSTCDNYQLIAPTSPPPTIPAPGESGKDRWELIYIGPTPPSGNCTRKVNLSVSYDCEDEVTTTTDLLVEDFLQIVPNPTEGAVNINLYHPELNGTLDIQLYNQIGQLVHHFKANKTTANYVLPLMMDDLNPGVYFLDMNVNGEQRYMEKLVKY